MKFGRSRPQRLSSCGAETTMYGVRGRKCLLSYLWVTSLHRRFQCVSPSRLPVQRTTEVSERQTTGSQETKVRLRQWKRPCFRLGYLRVLVFHINATSGNESMSRVPLPLVNPTTGSFHRWEPNMFLSRVSTETYRDTCLGSM